MSARGESRESCATTAQAAAHGQRFRAKRDHAPSPTRRPQVHSCVAVKVRIPTDLSTSGRGPSGADHRECPECESRAEGDFLQLSSTLHGFCREVLPGVRAVVDRRCLGTGQSRRRTSRESRHGSAPAVWPRAVENLSAHRTPGGRPVTVVCETKATVSAAEVEKFLALVAKLRAARPDEDIRPLFFGYRAQRKARELIVEAGAAMVFTRGVMIPAA